jgi:hypothetical protein
VTVRTVGHLLFFTFGTILRADDLSVLDYQVERESVYQQLSPDFCWFHPRLTALPGFGRDGRPAVIVTLQKHLAASDHYSGLFFMRTDDLGATWSEPLEVPELAWRKAPKNATIAVIDVTPGWHAQSGKMVLIGAKTMYTAKGDHLRSEERSYETSYATYDPKNDQWTPWRELTMPETDGKFYRVGCGCSQWLVRPDGRLLVPVQYRPANEDTNWSATVLECDFDGRQMTYRKHGDELTVDDGGYGFAEPSIAFFQGTYYLTLRQKETAAVATSNDGLHYKPYRSWKFDDNTDLGSYNTQTHWLVHRDGLYLAYTRRGANNDHVTWNRAPLFIAQVDPDKLQIIRSTEKVLLPDRGVMMGNFGTAAITTAESWVTTAELISHLIDPMAGHKPHPRGGDGTVWLGRVRWSKPDLPQK